jgi:NAD(P)-dependent dehydrogenase (short-subunit alcohol dehydrogenase family)
MTSEKRLKGRIALVTGASRGLGRAVALALAKEGAHIVAVGRTQGALEELDDDIRAKGGKSTLLTLDLRQFDRVDQLGPTLFQRWGKLDIFVANAGILGPLSPLPHITSDAWASVIDTNLNANWRLIRTLDPLLKLSDAGRAVFVSSGAASGTNAYWGPYAVSKAGLEALARTYAEELQNSSVRANIVNPGAMRTAMRARAFPGEDPLKLPTPEDVAPFVVSFTIPEVKANGETFSFRTSLEKKPVILAEHRNGRNGEER